MASIESQPTPSGPAQGKETSFDSVRRNVEVEPLDQTRSDLVANLAHDLRTPFVSIRGYIKMMLEERAGPINSTQREYLTIVAENTNHVLRLLNDLLQLTMEQPLRWEPFDVRNLWREALALVRPRALGKSIEMTERIPAKPLVIVGDRQKLLEGFTALLFNAVKFTDHGGKILVEVSNNNEEGVTVRISDAGAEISAKLLGEVGQPEASTPDSRKNLSTGLSGVHEIIRSHGGRLSVSSNTGAAVTFLVTLPAL